MPTAIKDLQGVRHFEMPQPIEDRLANTTQGPPFANGPTKPKEVKQQFTEEQKKPLASHTANKDVEQGITFAAQDSLQKLPIPELENSLKKYLAALRPLQSPKEHAETQQACEEFLKGEGPALQEKLKKYANGKASFIEQFCKSIHSSKPESS